MRTAALFVLALPFAASLVCAQGAAPAPSLARAADGKPLCGLGKAFHAGRRAELRKRLKKGVVLVRGLPPTRDYEAFHQDKIFWYLTGIESADAALLMDCESGKELLFLPRPNQMKEGWEGEMWDSQDEWVRELTGFAELREEDTLDKELAQFTKGEQTVWIAMQPSVNLAGAIDRAAPYDRRQEKDPFDGRTSREKALAQALEKLEHKPKDLCAELNEMRRVKTSEEIAALRRASRAGALAQLEAMRSTRAGLSEGELGGLMSMVQLREGADGPAYQPIIGSGPNACVLHYSGMHRLLRAGEGLLIDYAPEVDHYTSDITRTWPVDGHFSPRLRELYEVVLESQKAGIAIVKPGIKLRDVEAACAKVLRERGFTANIRHGACHYVGLEVHDAGDFGKALEPGVCFTIEPGLYDEQAGVGVRIEDTVVVTADGCEILSKDAPKEIAEVEAAVAASGLLDPR